MDTIVAKAVFHLEGDETRQEYQSMIVLHEEALWFVANWIVETATGKRIPAELIPMAKLPHFFHPPDGPFRLHAPIPKELGTYPMPEKLRLAYTAAANPLLVHIPGPPAIQ